MSTRSILLTSRGLTLAVLAASTALSACFGRGRSAPRPGGANPPTRADSTPVTPPGGVPPIMTAADIIRRDSLRADSARTDSLRRITAALDAARESARLDSIRRDSVAKANPAARPAPRASRQCLLDFSESPPETRITYNNIVGNASTLIGGGVIARCQGENNRIKADSAEQFANSGIINLFGNVVYEEPGKMRILSSRATYFTREQRLNADGGVIATQISTGSTFEGPSIEYLRPLAGVRPTSRLIAPGRPTATIIERDSAGAPRPPVRITANMMQDEGDSLLFAWGQVIVVRNNLRGEADSGSYDKIGGRSRLIRQARVANEDGNRSFRLVGDTIDLFNRDRVIDRVLALHEASATNQDLVMRAERLDLRLTDQRIERAFAFGAGRATTVTPQQELTADSIMVHLPNQRVREVVAIGRAVTSGKPDSTKIRSEDRDVLRGDTVIARFDTTTRRAAPRAAAPATPANPANAANPALPPGSAAPANPRDTASQPRIEQIRALGNASSLFQIASSQGPTAPPAINYVRGKRIDVAFDTGAVRTVTVDSSATGYYFEPVRDSLADSTRRDTTGARRAAPPATPPRRPPPRQDRPEREDRQERPDPLAADSRSSVPTSSKRRP